MQRLSLSLKRTLRNKKNYFLLVVLMICFVITAVSFVIQDNITSYINDSFYKELEFRIVIAENNLDAETREELEANEHVVTVTNRFQLYSYVYTDDFKDLGYFGNLELNLGINGIVPPVILGENLTEDKTGMMICPYYFYPGERLTYENIQEKGALNPKDYLNKDVHIYYNHSDIDENGQEITKRFDQTFKIIGFYDNTSTVTSGGACYITYDDKQEIVNNLGYNTSEIMQNQSNWIVMDDTNSYDEIISILQKHGNDGFRDAYFNENTIADWYLTVRLIIIVSVFASFMIVLNFVYKHILSNLKDYQLRISLGYQKKDIVIEKITELTIIVILAIIIGVFLFGIGSWVAKLILADYYGVLGIRLYFRLSVLALSVFVGIILPFLLSMFFIWFYFGKQKSYRFLNK